MRDTIRLSAYSQFVWQAPFDFSRHSSIGCGGRAKAVFYPRSFEETERLLSRLQADGARYIVVGNMTNVLPPDGETDAVVVCTKRLDGISFASGVFVGAGVTAYALLRECKRRGLSGAEFLYGIPCTLGGALYMNAGAGGRYIAEIVESVLVLREGKRVVVPFLECGYAYKTSVFMENTDVILGASLRLEKADSATIEGEVRRYAARRAHLPKGRSMGCVFKNVDGVSAGELIEKSGLKGFAIGGARVSDTHANFILNEGGATSADIRALITLVKNAVRAQYGVRLEEEIRYL